MRQFEIYLMEGHCAGLVHYDRARGQLADTMRVPDSDTDETAIKKEASQLHPIQSAFSHLSSTIRQQFDRTQDAILKEIDAEDSEAIRIFINQVSFRHKFPTVVVLISASKTLRELFRKV